MQESAQNVRITPLPHHPKKRTNIVVSLEECDISFPLSPLWKYLVILWCGWGVVTFRYNVLEVANFVPFEDGAFCDT